MRAYSWIIALCLIFPLPVLACIGPPAESRTFLNDLPPDADMRDVVASVIILSTTDNGNERHSKVRVLEGIKGAVKGQIITVISEMHSCAVDYDVAADEKYFIAGKMGPDKTFRGVWRGDYPLEYEER